MSSLSEFYRAPGGRIFGVVWVGQLVSNLGSATTSFGLAIWVFQETGSATQLASNRNSAQIRSGSRVGLMFILAGLLVATTAIVAYRHRRIRSLENEVPDLDDELLAA